MDFLSSPSKVLSNSDEHGVAELLRQVAQRNDSSLTEEERREVSEMATRVEEQTTPMGKLKKKMKEGIREIDKSLEIVEEGETLGSEVFSFDIDGGKYDEDEESLPDDEEYGGRRMRSISYKPPLSSSSVRSSCCRISFKIGAVVALLLVVGGVVLAPTTPLNTGFGYFDNSNTTSGSIFEADNKNTEVWSPDSIGEEEIQTEKHNGNKYNNDEDKTIDDKPTDAAATNVFKTKPPGSSPNDSKPIIDSSSNQNIIKIACVGDSITYGSCGTQREGTTYPDQLKSYFDPKRYEITNYGRAGKTVGQRGICHGSDENQTIYPCSYWDTPEYKAALASSPDIVTIMLGTNDAKPYNWDSEKGNDDFLRDYTDLVKSFSALPSVKSIYLAIPPPLVHPPKHPEYPIGHDMIEEIVNDRLPMLIPLVAVEEFEDCQGKFVSVVDVFHALGGPEGYFDSSMTCDGIHPSKKANDLIAKAFANKMAIDWPTLITTSPP